MWRVRLSQHRAEIIEAESELDEEVAQLMESDTARLQTDNGKLIVKESTSSFE